MPVEESGFEPDIEPPVMVTEVQLEVLHASDDAEPPVTEVGVAVNDVILQAAGMPAVQILPVP